MKKNYLKIAFRQLIRYKGYSFINIMGLAVGIASCILIMLFVKSEYSFDKFNSKAARIYRVWLQENISPDQVYTSTVTPLPLGPALQTSFPEIEAACRVFTFNANVKTTGENANSASIHMVDPALFHVFDFRILEGNPEKPFATVNSVILTKDLAKKYYPHASPVGQVLKIQLGDEYVPFIVSAVAENTPEESSVRFDMLISFENAHYIFDERQLKAWHQIFPETYVLLKSASSTGNISSKLVAFTKQVLGSNYRPGEYNLHLQPLTSIHLDTSLPQGIQPVSSPVYSYVLSSIGFMILLIACINFITLSIGRSATRAMEVGVRKVLGAERKQLIQQFWSETFLFTVISAIAGLIMALSFLKYFNALFQRDLSFSFDPYLFLFFLLLMLFIAFFAGIYPAVILSSYNPNEVFKGKSKNANKKGWLRQVLIGAQFVASISMIVCTIVVSRQLKYIQNKDLGYKKDQVVVVPMNVGNEAGEKLAAVFCNEIKKMPQVKAASVSMYTFAQTDWVHVGYNDVNNKYHEFRMNAVDADFLNTMKIPLVMGRNFLPGNANDKSSGIIANEAFVKEYGWKNPVGQKLGGRFSGEVIGVVKDFNYESLHSKIFPLVLVMQPDSVFHQAGDITISYSTDPRVTVLLQPGNISENMELLKAAWTKIESARNFEYEFLDETLKAQYADEQRTGRVILLASGLSIFIACMGLFGLSTLVVSRRTKEIGIRKILGAHAGNIVALISRDFLIIVSLAAIVAFPLAYYAMNKWLENFEYRIGISWWILPASAMVALMVTLATVGVQALQAATENPVKSLRTE
jgi:putative ABC transport system permease protein